MDLKAATKLVLDGGLCNSHTNSYGKNFRSTGKGSAKWALPLLDDPTQLPGSKPPYRVTVEMPHF
ncbi:hypothetical protein Hanom_Chr05g00426811 [Helianthus anomalus]